MVVLKYIATILGSIFLFSCGNKIYQADFFNKSNVTDVFSDKKNNVVITLGLKDNTVDSLVLNTYLNYVHQSKTVLHGRHLKSKLINEKLYILTLSEKNYSELYEFDYLTNHINELDDNLTLELWNSNYDICSCGSQICVVEITQDTTKSDNILKISKDKVLDTIHSNFEPIGYACGNDFDYLLVKDNNVLSMIRYAQNNLNDQKELFKFETKFDDYTLKIRVDEDDIYVIINASTGESEIWRNPKGTNELYYYRAFTFIGDAVKINDEFVISYLDKMDLEKRKYFTKMKTIKKWWKYPFVFFD